MAWLVLRKRWLKKSLSDFGVGGVMFVKMIANDHELLGQFTRAQSQAAFTALVDRHLDLVYSAALRQVRSPQLAEEVAQAVFLQLAHHAARLRADTLLTAWLYQVTRNAAIDVVRREARRQAREQIACEMSAMKDPSTDWTRIEPLLDEAMHSLDDADRAAILLRYFENKSLREVGQALGATEDAAQKRVGRALERLRAFFAKREITVGASGLAALVSAHAIQAAPSGLAASVAAGTALATGALSVSTTATLTQAIAMTTLQKTLIAALAFGALVAGVYQSNQVSTLRQEVQTLRQQQEQQGALSNEVAQLRRERDRGSNALAALTRENAALKKNPTEVQKLRGEVGRLRLEKDQIGSSSALSKVTANPEARKMLRDQQKTAMTMVYKSLAKRLKLTSEQTDQFNEVLADHIMENVDHVTTVLRDKPTPERITELFGAQEAALLERVQALLGQEGLTQYQEYTRNLLGSLSTEQFQGKLTGTGPAKEEKTAQLRQAFQEATQGALAAAGLPADYQTVPMLNFRNIASEPDAERSLKLLEEIYQRVATRGSSFLAPEELTQLQEFKAAALKNNRAALTLNRTMMAPISN